MEVTVLNNLCIGGVVSVGVNVCHIVCKVTVSVNLSVYVELLISVNSNCKGVTSNT